jgi:hypothetical protein
MKTTPVKKVGTEKPTIDTKVPTWSNQLNTACRPR